MTDPDAVERFTAVHLHGRVERAVYRVLTLAPSEYWAPSEVAEHAGADEHVVGAVLRQFAAAGIVDAELVASGLRRYRARPAASFLAEAPSTAVMIDPVCGMLVDPATPFVLGRGAATVHFCSQRCLLLWERRDRDSTAGPAAT